MDVGYVRGAWLLGALSLLACESTPLVVVEMRTDFVLGVEATSGTLFVDDVEVAAPRFGVEDDGRAGVRIAELGDVLPGSHTFRLELAGPAGRMLAEQHLRVDVRNGIAVTLLVQRRCSGVECTVAGMTACYAGECVDDRCSPETPEHCPTPECETDADCGVHCGTSACVDGACFLDPTACYDTRLVVTVTCDNTYGVGLGPSLDGYFTQDTLQAHEIFACSATCLTDADCGTGACSLFASCDDDGYGPERHVWDVADLAGVDTLYITAWDHTGGGGGQGFSAEVRGPVGRAVTGDDRFEVCATNMEAGGTDAVMMAARIADCDARDGWLGATGPFPRLAIGAPPVPVCQAAGRGDALPADAEWVWYAPDETTDPFLDTSPGEVLIFRVRLDGVVR